MKFSICIPNYNYGRYLGRTIQSVLDQTYQDFEILVSDNASPDDSVDVVKRFGDPRIQLRVNEANVGFAGNLDRAASMATGEWMILLSSDDLMRPTALAQYKTFIEALGTSAERAIFCSAVDVIDPVDKITGRMGPYTDVWKESDRSRAPNVPGIGAPIYAAPAGELLKRCLLQLKNPFHFAATCYPRSLYRRVEGYGGGRLQSPDKWFNWKMLAAADQAYFLDENLFAYRIHNANQFSQETAAGALKYLVDQYVATLEFDRAALERIGLKPTDLEQAFVEYDIGRHGLRSLATTGRVKARRVLNFGRATYPQHAARNRTVWALRGLLALGPIGTWIARQAYARRQS